MKVVILAGGRGTRISEESQLRPKPMVEIGERPILWHIMKIYSHYGFNDFVICVGYKGQMIKEFFADYYVRMSDVTFDFREKNKTIVHENVAEPWRVTLVDTGLETLTGGRLARVRKYLDNEPFMLTYGDGVGDVDINRLVQHHFQNRKTVTMTAIQPGGRFGVLNLDGAENIIGFTEKAKEDGGWINAGFMVMEPEIFRYLEGGDNCILEQYPLQKLSSEGGMTAYKHHGFWHCMDTQRDKLVLEDMWNQNNAPWKLWES
ncbi:glucose-1-phosphate cytidylyltransferase [Gorillibacterium sp. CAU 1737]|uniref:glucose-1-phosphate cytidylyltransferase n=1 Tax=Gorillibacterium sp. CAU 1737 TaxID=3140362 RepID=UPI003260AEDC